MEVMESHGQFLWKEGGNPEFRFEVIVLVIVNRKKITGHQESHLTP